MSELTYNEKAQRYQDPVTGRFVKSPENISKFDSLLASIGKSMEMQSSFLESLYNRSVSSENEIRKHTGLLQRMVELQEIEVKAAMEQRRYNDEERERIRNEKALNPEPRELPTPVTPQEKERRSFGIVPAIGIGGIADAVGKVFKVAAIAAIIPVAWRFIQGFVDAKTDGGFTKAQGKVLEIINNVNWAGMMKSMTDFVTNIDWTAFTSTLSTFSAAFMAVDWEKIGNSLLYLAENWDKMLIAVGALTIGMKTLKGALITRALLNAGGGVAGKGLGLAAKGKGLMSLFKRLIPWAGPAAAVTATVTPSELGDGTLDGAAAKALEEEGITPENTPVKEYQDAIRRRAQQIIDAIPGPDETINMEDYTPKSDSGTGLIPKLLQEWGIMSGPKGEQQKLLDRINQINGQILDIQNGIYYGNKPAEQKLNELITYRDKLIDQKLDAISTEGARSATAPVVIQGGDNIRGGDNIKGGTTNVTTINNTIDPSKSLNALAN